MKHTLSLIASILVALVVLFLPESMLPFAGITVIEQRVMALFVLAAVFWIVEPIPVYATSVLIIVLELLMISDKSLIFFAGSKDDPSFGTALSHKAIMATFAHPIILLFLGGFFLAMATSKYRLDLNLARVMLKPFGKNPKLILLGLMTITAIFSMFMSNTATTAMMFAILTPVLGAFEVDDRGRIAYILGIPFAANIGGIGTPIGTPPNAIAIRYLTGDNAISFAGWMAFAVPFVIVMLIFAWVLLLWFFPPKTDTIEVKIKSKFLTHWRAMTLYITFAVTVLLWVIGSASGMNSYVIAMIPVAVFSVTQIITKEDLKNLSWDVLWLVAGGFALGLALEDSGLSKRLIESIPFGTFSPYFIVLTCSALTLLMGTFMSHTATANLLMPVIVVLGTTLSSLEPLGGGKMLILTCTFAASLAMALPVSTPPNAIAYASGMVDTRHMMKTGVIISSVGLIGVYGLMIVLRMVGVI
ncbi:MAG: SLC13 family permease [Candidatus Hinthialibacter antarcticus]|nr:SLC13 family permease [Candidatus Hinthialibacter antarcticus]